MEHARCRIKTSSVCFARPNIFHLMPLLSTFLRFVIPPVWLMVGRDTMAIMSTEVNKMLILLNRLN